MQNLTFADGNSTGEKLEGGGGGAAIRVLSQYRGLPVFAVNSTFGGAARQGGVCSNGGALSGIGVSWAVLNSVMTHNSAPAIRP